MTSAYIENFRNTILHDGIKLDTEIIPDGEIHRFYVDGDSSNSTNGWYILYADGIPSGAYGCWKRNISKSWCSKSKNEMSPLEWLHHETLIKEIKAKRDKTKAEAKAKASEKATLIWEKAKPANDTYTYLKNKKIENYGLRYLRVFNNNQLIVPIHNPHGVLESLQFIKNDGAKWFLIDGAIKGNYFLIGEIKSKVDKLGIGEGFATCATINQETGCAIVCAFNCGNLLAVARTMRAKYPDAEIIIFADNDQWPDENGIVNNRGLNKAHEAAKTIGAKIISPDFTGLDIRSKPTDFNDLLLLGGKEEVKRQIENINIGVWPDPEVIQNELLPVETLPPEIIPEPFREFVTDVADRMQCPLDFIAITTIIAASSVIGAGCGIRPKKEDNWLIIPNLWGCIIGRPGIMKTPAVGEVMRFLETLQNESKKSQDKDMQAYAADIEIYKAKRIAIENKIKSIEKSALTTKLNSSSENNEDNEWSSDELKKLLIELKEPEKPIWRRFKTNDSTIEKLSELLSENNRGLLVYRDELMGWLKTFDKLGHESDRAFFLEAWNGDSSQTSDRISRGTIHTENLCLSVFGTTQPDKLISYLYGAVYGENDGLIQRFQLLIYPDEPKTWNRVDKKPNLQAKTHVANIIKNLADMDFIQHGAIQHEGDRFPYFRFSEDGQTTFYEWWEELEREKLKSDDHPILIEHLSKYRKLMPALALLFHLIELADGKGSREITNANVKNAAAWVEYLESHARRVYALVTEIDTKAASLLAEKITKSKLKNKFTVRDVYRLKGYLKKKEIAQAACDELVEANWLREVITPSSFGQKRTVSYLINPKILCRMKNG